MNDFLTDLYSSHFTSQARQNEFKGQSGTEERMVVKVLERNRNAANTRTPPVQQPNQPHQYPPVRNNRAPYSDQKQEAQPKKKGFGIFEFLCWSLIIGQVAALVYVFAVM